MRGQACEGGAASSTDEQPIDPHKCCGPGQVDTDIKVTVLLRLHVCLPVHRRMSVRMPTAIRDGSRPSFTPTSAGAALVGGATSASTGRWGTQRSKSTQALTRVLKYFAAPPAAPLRRAFAAALRLTLRALDPKMFSAQDTQHQM